MAAQKTSRCSPYFFYRAFEEARFAAYIRIRTCFNENPNGPRSGARPREARATEIDELAEAWWVDSRLSRHGRRQGPGSGAGRDYEGWTP